MVSAGKSSHSRQVKDWPVWQVPAGSGTYRLSLVAWYLAPGGHLDYESPVKEEVRVWALDWLACLETLTSESFSSSRNQLSLGGVVCSE